MEPSKTEHEVLCPNCDLPAEVVVERSVAPDGQAIKMFRCTMLCEQPGCRFECLPEDQR